MRHYFAVHNPRGFPHRDRRKAAAGPRFAAGVVARSLWLRRYRFGTALLLDPRYLDEPPPNRPGFKKDVWRVLSVRRPRHVR